MAKTVFDQIKKQNGERFAKAIRAYDNGIFDIPNIVDILKYAGTEAEPIMQYLVSLKNIRIEEQSVHKDPITLLDEAGYDAYYADTLEKQNAIQRYYAPGEGLCTFRDPRRFEKYFIINAVRKDVDSIKREDFRGKEKREDRYGTSVLSIQILKNGGFISIKNRYNHTVENPDNTLDSNPDNIIKGLSDAIKHHLNVDFSAQETPLPDKFIELHGQVVHYNFERNDIYFGDHFYVKNGEIHPIDRDKEILMDQFIFNTKTKTIENVDPEQQDSFPDVLMEEIQGKKIQITKAPPGPDGKSGYLLKADNIPVLLVQDGHITELNLQKTTNIDNNFCRNCRDIKKFSAPTLESVGNGFLTDARITDLNIPQIRRVGSHFLNSVQMENIEFPYLESAKHSFMSFGKLKSCRLPRLRKAGDSFLRYASKLTDLYVPQLAILEGNALASASEIQTLSFPSLTSVGYGFLREVKSLTSLDCPKVQTLDRECLVLSDSLTLVNLPLLREAGNDFLSFAKTLKVLNCPNLEKVGDNCLGHNRGLTTLSLPALQEIGSNFLQHNYALSNLDCPQLRVMGNDCLRENNQLVSINCPNLEEIGLNCFQHLGEGSSGLLLIIEEATQQSSGPLKEPQKLRCLNLPNLRRARKGFLEKNAELEILDAPLLDNVATDVLSHNNHYKTNAPGLKPRLSKDRWLTVQDVFTLSPSNQTAQSKEQKSQTHTPQKRETTVLCKKRVDQKSL